MKRLYFALCFILAAIAAPAQDLFPEWFPDDSDELQGMKIEPDFTIDGISYHIIPKYPDEVAVMNCHPLWIYRFHDLTTNLEALGWTYETPATTTATVPATVSHEGKDYTVTMVLYGAFARWTSLRSVTLPETITEVREGAFGGCTALEHAPALHAGCLPDWTFVECAAMKSIDLSPYTSFGYYPLSGCAGLEEVCLTGYPDQVGAIGSRFFTDYWNAPDIEVKGELKRIYITEATAATESLTCHDDAFSATEYATATLYVPAGSREAFAASPFWSRFARIEEGAYSGTAKIETDLSDAPAEYYNLQGLRVANPAAGAVYIRRRGTNAVKVKF